MLYRQFLFRLMDVELLSGSARGDASALLGQFGSLLVFGGLLLSWFGLIMGGQAQRAASAAPVWAAERFMVSLTMLVVGVFALLNWDSTFLDRRDVMVLAPLPVRARTLFTARIAAAASALGLTVVALNSLAGFVWPMALAPAGSGAVGILRMIAAFWIALAAAGTFLYCAVLAVQAAAAQLPRRWYLRVSSFLQIGGFVLFLGVICFQPSFNGAAALGAPENQRALACLPSYWFLGLLSELSGAFPSEGHEAMAALAQRAVVNLAIAIIVAGGAFLLSYLRTLRKIVEEPDIVPGSRGGVWLPRFGSAPTTALTRFVIRTLLRSRQHRAILAFYLGGGFAIVAVYLEGGMDMLHLTWMDLLRHVNPFIPVASVLMLCASWLGVRTMFSLPLDLRANWLFRVTPDQERNVCLAAVRRALLTLAVLPVVSAFGALLVWFWPWRPAIEHLLLLGLLGSVLTDVSLRGFRKIPFTCSYLPGKSKVHLAFWFGVIPVVMAIHKAAAWEQGAMANLSGYWTMAGCLAGAAIAGRVAANRSAPGSGPETQFEEFPSDELVGLGLSR